MSLDSHSHYKIYKPFGILSQFISNDDKEARKKRFLGELHSFPQDIMPVGRLDEKSEGLLLLTTDGKLSDTINRMGIEKEYHVQLDGEITTEAMALLQEGVEIGFHGKRYYTKPSKLHYLEEAPTYFEPDPKLRIGRHRPTSWISITITEGKFRQVRKMTAAVGFPTVRLIRVRIGTIGLENLTPGEVVQVKEISL
ncbi:pseudouridine synthase [Arenibacter certesii]|uniref:Pseudouridine synthase n=1 Tax=Arenibacter certesii TaxID=228955 RepID=A0A918IL70_9FLAO|nr:pseudouridine synthase [Arenibacter certesii]GGW21676.1 pseudouridine synthase [Arenibacter certesii]